MTRRGYVAVLYLSDSYWIKIGRKAVRGLSVEGIDPLNAPTIDDLLREPCPRTRGRW